MKVNRAILWKVANTKQNGISSSQIQKAKINKGRKEGRKHHLLTVQTIISENNNWKIQGIRRYFKIFLCNTYVTLLLL